jgi:hypothetical protein
VQKRISPFQLLSKEMGGPIGQKRNLRLNKDEVGSIFARTAVVHVHPGPSSVAARGDHILKPGHLAFDTVAGAAIAKVGSAGF